MPCRRRDRRASIRIERLESRTSPAAIGPGLLPAPAMLAADVAAYDDPLPDPEPTPGPPGGAPQPTSGPIGPGTS